MSPPALFPFYTNHFTSILCTNLHITQKQNVMRRNTYKCSYTYDTSTDFPACGADPLMQHAVFNLGHERAQHSLWSLSFPKSSFLRDEDPQCLLKKKNTSSFFPSLCFCNGVIMADGGSKGLKTLTALL